MEEIEQQIKEWKATRDGYSWGSVTWCHARGVIHGLEESLRIIAQNSTAKSCPLYVDYKNLAKL